MGDFNWNLKEIEAILEDIKSRGASFADIHLVDRESTGVMVQDGRADKVDRTRTLGAGIRVLAQGAWGFASLNSSDPKLIARELEQALTLARASALAPHEQAQTASIPPAREQWVSPHGIDPRSVPLKEKIRDASAVEKAARSADPNRIVNTIVNYRDYSSNEAVVNTLGAAVEFVEIRTMISCLAVARDESISQMGRERRGALAGYEIVRDLDPETLSGKAARKALDLLKAVPPPAGTFPVIFDSSVAGLLAHEAVGHNIEADLVHSGQSIVSDKLGKKIGSELVTLIDDPTLEGFWGSFAFDSEGTRARKRIPVENGVLKGFLHTLETAAIFGVEPNGAGRAMNHHCKPIVRMSNTFFAPGTRKIEDMIREIDDGILCRGAGSGYVMPEKGLFNTNVEQAWRIRKGEIAEPIRDLCLSGLTLEALMNVDAVSDELEIKSPGTCGKDGQGVPVDDGGPNVRVTRLVVGGQNS